MGLKIQQIHYRNFRNYDNYELTDIGDVTVFVGPNAIGKTNLVEGIQLITAFNSFRSSKQSISFASEKILPLLEQCSAMGCVSLISISPFMKENARSR